MKKCGKAVFVILVLCVLLLVLLGCNNPNMLDESDNNIKAITIENLSKAVEENPFQLFLEEYNDNGIVINTKTTKFGKNAEYSLYEQYDNIGLAKSFTNVIGRLEDNDVYRYSDTVSHLPNTAEQQRGHTYLSKSAEKSTTGKTYEELLLDDKASAFSGFLFNGFHTYLKETGQNIYQVADGMAETYGRLAAESYGAKGIEYIIQNAKTLQIKLLENNEVEMSYMSAGTTQLRVKKITRFGRNYVLENEYRGYFVQVKSEGKAIDLLS